jgi:NAD kinase
MPADNERKVILVTRKTRLEDLIARYLTAEQARFYVEQLGGDFSDYQREHDVFVAERRRTVRTLEQWGRYHVIDRSFLPNFIFGPDDIVVALGQDGLVANAMKYLDGHPLIGLNPDAGRYDGILLPFVPDDLPLLLAEVAAGRRAGKAVTMAKAALADGQVLHAVNDLFVGARSHVSARYEIAAGTRQETQSSSGLIVATGLGSTAWFKSIVTGRLWQRAEAPALSRIAMGGRRAAFCRSRAVSEPHLASDADLRATGQDRGTAHPLADARERSHFLGRHRGRPARIQFRGRSADHRRRAPGPADRVTAEGVRTPHRRPTQRGAARAS